MGRPKKITALTKVNGNASTPSSINALLGDNGLGKYGTLDENVYRKQLEQLSTPELHLAATKEGIKPIHSRELIIRSLLTAFYKYKNTYFGVIGNVSEPNQKVDSELQEILRTMK